MNNNYEVKKDCFAYRSRTNECNALKELYCKKEKCKFYESRENHIKKLMKERV